MCVKCTQKTKKVELHLHSCYSLIDGMGKPEDIVKRVKELGQSAFAVTEHGNVFSAVKFYKLAKEYSLKHIYGIEFYIAENRFEQKPEHKYNHLTVLAKNEKGRLNINKLSSLGYIEGFYSKPRIDYELLEKHKEGLIVMSGCMASAFQQALSGGKIGEGNINISDQNIVNAKGVAKWHRDVFGEDYYIEVQSHRDPRQQQLNRAAVDIAKDLGIEYVVTADSHFVNEEDFELHEIFIQISQNREVGEMYRDTHIQDEGETIELLKPGLTEEEINLAIANTSIIADKCNVSIPLSEPLIPHVEVPAGFQSEADYLKHLCHVGWKKRQISKRTNVKAYQERLVYEFNSITKMGFEGYFLFVESYVNSVKRRGIARGSGGGSLVAYLLNIVDIDPIKYGLYFERFIDVGALDLLDQGVITRKELKVPDIDSDFGRKDREKVVQSIIDRYGEKHFASLGQFQYIWDKTAIKDIGKVLGVPFEVTNKITKLMDIDTITEILKEGKLKQYTEAYPQLFEYAEKIAGTPKSFAVHPCGKVSSIEETTDYTALASSKGNIVLQGDMDDAEDLGLVKADVLGLRTVDVIYDTLEMINKDYEYINPDKMNFDDPKVYEIFQQGHTEGMFQFESNGMKSTLKKMKPTRLDDLGVANALFRPGSMKFIDDYVERKHGGNFSYLHEDLKPILEVTFGIIVFQEQLIEIGRLANMRNPDLLRQATGKKDIKKLNKAKPELSAGLKSRGWSEENIEDLWAIMLDFAKYSFNKSHSYAYAIIAYITAYLKCYHPTEFICALFNSYIDGGGQDKYESIGKIYYEAKRLGINVAVPKFGEAETVCTIKNGTVHIGLHLIKSLNGTTAIDLKALHNSRVYETFTDLLVDISNETTLNKGNVETLIQLDHFSRFGAITDLMNFYSEFREGKGVKYDKKHKQGTKDKRIALLKEKEKEALSVGSVPRAHERVEYEISKLGFAVYTDESLPHSHTVVIEIDKKKGATPVVTLYKLRTGEQLNAKVKKKIFYQYEDEDLLYVGDIIEVANAGFEEGWKPPDENGEFHRDPSKKELHLYSCTFVELSPLRF